MIGKFAYQGGDVAEDIRNTYGYTGVLADIFATNHRYTVHKWHHYIPLYDQYFARYRGTKVRFLEIGVAKGGSQQMWRRFLGDEAVIFGIDINEKCHKLNGRFGQVRIGSQDDPDFLSDVVDEMGGIDVVLDDGSHRMGHIAASLTALYPRLSDGGIYMIEDLHTSYWRRFGGGFDEKANFFNVIRDIIDDMHQCYHGHDLHLPKLAGAFSGVHLHDSIVVIEKGTMPRPRHSKVR